MLTWRPYFELGFVEVYSEGVYAGRIWADHAEPISSGAVRLWDGKTVAATLEGQRLGCPVALCANSSKWYPKEPAR